MKSIAVLLAIVAAVAALPRGLRSLEAGIDALAQQVQAFERTGTAITHKPGSPSCTGETYVPPKCVPLECGDYTYWTCPTETGCRKHRVVDREAQLGTNDFRRCLPPGHEGDFDGRDLGGWFVDDLESSAVERKTESHQVHAFERDQTHKVQGGSASCSGETYVPPKCVPLECADHTFLTCPTETGCKRHIIEGKAAQLGSDPFRRCLPPDSDGSLGGRRGYGGYFVDQTSSLERSAVERKTESQQVHGFERARTHYVDEDSDFCSGETYVPPKCEPLLCGHYEYAECPTETGCKKHTVYYSGRAIRRCLSPEHDGNLGGRDMGGTWD